MKAVRGGTNEESLQTMRELVKLNVANLVPISAALSGGDNGGVAGQKGAGLFGQLFDKHSSLADPRKNTISFDRVERKIMQAIFFFKGQAPPGAKDQTIFNRELFQQLNQRYRTDELHRLDILELVVKAKKFHFLNVQCKDLCIWEDEEKIIKLDKVNIETNQKRLRIKNIEAARAKHRLKEQNVMYASALRAVRPACVGTGQVSFGQFDFGLPRDGKFENALYTRFVKFVKYGMCERCQYYYLERGHQERQTLCQPVQSMVGGATAPVTNKSSGNHSSQPHHGGLVSSSEKRHHVQHHAHGAVQSGNNYLHYNAQGPEKRRMHSGEQSSAQHHQQKGGHHSQRQTMHNAANMQNGTAHHNKHVQQHYGGYAQTPHQQQFMTSGSVMGGSTGPHQQYAAAGQHFSAGYHGMHAGYHQAPASGGYAMSNFGVHYNMSLGAPEQHGQRSGVHAGQPHGTQQARQTHAHQPPAESA